MPIDTGALSAVSFDELAAMAQEQLDRSYKSTVADRKKLVELITELRDRADSATSEELLGPIGWQLVRLSVQGFGGIRNAEEPLVVDVVGGSAITLVRGDNGSGKSSLVSAAHFALSAGGGVSAPAVSGALWESDRVSDGAAAGWVEVQLVRGDETLVVTGVCPGSGEPTVTGLLVTDGGQVPVELGRTWLEALTASGVFFTYATLQARLQKSTDLQSYLEELLVLGPVWQLVHAELDQRAAASKADRQVLDGLRASAQSADRELTTRFLADTRRPAPAAEIVWPTRWSDDVDAWLAASVADTGPVVSVQVSDDHEQQASALTSQVDTTWRELDQLDRELDSPAVADVLERLLGEPDIDGASCPVCLQPADWRATARAVLSKVQGRAQRIRAVRAASQSLSEWVDTDLLPLVEADVGGAPLTAVQALRAEVRRDGHAPRPALREVVTQLTAAMADPAYGHWLARVRSASDASAEWAEARRQTMAPLVAAWRERGSRAADADGWDIAAKTLATMQVDERQRRQDRLTMRLQDAIDRLLPDAGVRLSGIKHKGGAKQQRGVDLRMTIGGQNATLGMLSSGQRNALLLASLLCIGPPAPFGFVVIDDPVHALDDLRVDLLAKELTALAQDRQVIVLTHDARLEEHLRARIPELHMRVLDRTPAESTVRATVVASPWDQLLRQASTVLDTAAQDEWQAPLPVEDVVAGLCRNAVDGAIRQAVVTRALGNGIGMTAALEAMDKAGKQTRRRIGHVIDLAGGEHSLPRTVGCRDRHLDRWNGGVHGTSGADPDLKKEIKDARAACKELDEWPFR